MRLLPSSLFLRHWKISVSFLVLAIVYLCQSLLVRPDAATLARYHLTSLQAHELGLGVEIPYIIIWFVALVGYLHLRAYVSAIRDSSDGQALKIIARGVLVLTVWLPLSTIIGNAASQIYTNHPDVTANMVRLSNYINLIIIAPAFVYLYLGSRRLTSLVKRQPGYKGLQYISLSFITISPLYTYMTLLDPARHVAENATQIASYYQPDWLIVLTFVIPRLLMWYVGIQAIYNIYVYSRHVRGSLYRIALKQLATGLGWVTGMIIILRCLQSLSAPLSHLNLGVVLLLIFFLLLLIAVGYGQIARGSRNLHKIEEL